MASQENHTQSQPNGLQPPQSAIDEGFLNGQQPVRDVSRQVLDVVTGQIIAARGHTQLGENIQARAQGLGTSVVARPPYEKAQYVGDHIPYHRGSDGQNIFDNASLMQEKLQAGLQQIAPLSLSGILATENLKASAQLMEDPIPRQIAFRDLQVWVEGSLDMYKPEFRPLLFPVFVHFYLDFVAQGFKEAAEGFFNNFFNYFSLNHRVVLEQLHTVTAPHHVHLQDLARRFRSEKYVVRMSKSGKELLLGWLMDGTGGEPMGAGLGMGGEEYSKKGRVAVMSVLNNRMDIQVTSAHSLTLSPNVWEESTGLLSTLVPSLPEGADPMQVDSNATSAEQFNSAHPALKLGLPGPDPQVKEEVEQHFRDEQTHAMQMANPSMPVPPIDHQIKIATATPVNGLPLPNHQELPPYPPNFRSIDVKREIEVVRDRRKRIKLEPGVLNALDKKEVSVNGFIDTRQTQIRARALPSICCYTFRDAPDGATASSFSPDVSLVATGFNESYIRLWNLKGEKLRGMRSDFDPADVKDAREVREKQGTSTRKLIGHSGPVYSLVFDPTGGSYCPPKYLLSGSADMTARLWSLDTMTNVVAYRGHSKPIWDVDWSPRGIYFATGSRDHTARLWSTDRIQPLRIFAGHLNDVDHVRFHPNSLYLATGSTDTTCRLWDVQQGVCVRVFLGHQGPVTAIATSPDGKYLASAGEDLAINLWDLGSGRRIKKMTGHTATVYSLAFSQESSLLVSGGADWTVRCWDVKHSGGLPPKKSDLNTTEDAVDQFGFPKNKKANGTGANTSADPVGNEQDAEDNFITRDLMETFPTKRTPILNVHFTPRNLCLVAGNFLPP